MGETGIGQPGAVDPARGEPNRLTHGNHAAAIRTIPAVGEHDAAVSASGGRSSQLHAVCRAVVDQLSSDVDAAEVDRLFTAALERKNGEDDDRSAGDA